MRKGYRARWVMIAPDVWLENAVLHTEGSMIKCVTLARSSAGVHDLGPGVIMPALVNAHAHLGLSMLREMGQAMHSGDCPTPFSDGLDQVAPCSFSGAGEVFPKMTRSEEPISFQDSSRFLNWVKELIACRESFTQEAIREAAIDAAFLAKQSGTGAMVEVGSPELAAEAMRVAGVDGVICTELLGNWRALPTLPEAEDELTFSYAGHGLHTTDPELLRSAKHAAEKQGQLFSLHLAESALEMEFLETGKGLWAELLTDRGIDFASWGPWGERPVARAARLGLLGGGTLAVHVLHVTRSELAELADTGTAVCVCPRSNEALHGLLPDIEGMRSVGLRPALGTDSLASAPTLSIFDEMAFVAARYSQLSPELILAMGTTWAAAAIGRRNVGSLRAGNRAAALYVELDGASPRHVAELLVQGKFERIQWL